jgi:hypothetical protein
METVTISHVNVIRIQRLEDTLIQRLRGAGGGRDVRDSNNGYSLAKTVVRGGRGAKKYGCSRTIYDNLTFKKVKPRDKQNHDDISLQQEIYLVIGDIIVEAFGHRPWYKAVQHMLSGIPSDRFFGDCRVPCSHIWWTSNPSVRHVHTDTNTTGVAFVFCSRTVTGGDLIVQTPNGPQKVHLEEGKILGGSWAQHAHCNEAVHPCDDRHSFVVYLNHRVISRDYEFVNKK